MTSRPRCAPCRFCVVRACLTLLVGGLVAMHLLRAPRDDRPVAQARAQAPAPRAVAPSCPSVTVEDALEQLLPADDWRLADQLQGATSKRGRVDRVRALVRLGLEILRRDREHVAISQLRAGLLATAPAEAAALRAVDGRGTHTGSDHMLVVTMADGLSRAIVPAVLDRSAPAAARTLRALPEVREARTARRARDLLEGHLARTRGPTHRAIEVAIRALDLVVRGPGSAWLSASSLAREVAGDGDPDEGDTGILVQLDLSTETRTQLGLDLLRRLVASARRHPAAPVPPPPPPLPPRLSWMGGRPW